MTQEGVSFGGAAIGPITLDARGLVPVVAQEEATGDVLLLAYMNEEALRRTLAEGVLVLWSRSRGRLWRKGEQSGHMLRVSELRVNCEGNSLLARVRLEGPGACHEGYRTCYFRRVALGAGGTFEAKAVEERVFDPEAVYGSLASGPPERTRDAPTQRQGGEHVVRSGGASISEQEEIEEFERETRELYAAYERLRNEDHTATSGTSGLLRGPDREAAARHAVRRGMDELGELRGAVAGTHRHRGGDEDVILEAGQVGYWAMVAAVALEHSYDAWRPHALWLAGWSDSYVALPPQEGGLLFDCAGLILAAGDQCREAGVHPARVVAADLAAMRAKYPNRYANSGLSQ